MVYTVIITGPEYGAENSISALFFSRALIMRKKHLIKNIFFYGDGALHANSFISFERDSFSVQKKWIMFSLKNKIRLSVCYSAALRRGIIHFQNLFNKKNIKGNLDVFFKISSLEELSRDIQKSDRVIQF